MCLWVTYRAVADNVHEELIMMMTENVTVMDSKQYCELMRGLNEKQRAIVMYNRRWCKDWIRTYLTGSMLDGYKVFLSGPRHTGKSYVISLIQWDMLRLLSPMQKPNADQLLVLLTAPTGSGAFHINGNMLQSALALDICQSRHGIGHVKSCERKWRVNHELAQLMLLVIDDVNMVGQKTMQQINKLLGEIKGNKRNCGGICMLAVGDLMELHPIKEPPLYYEPNHLSPSDMEPLLWDDVMVHELDEVMGEIDDGYRDMLHVIRLMAPAANSKEDLMLRSRELHVSPKDVQYPRSAVHVFVRNVYCDEWNEHELENLSGSVVEYRARDQIQRGDVRLADVTLPQHPGLTGNLRERLRLKVGAPVILTVNIDVRDGLTHGIMGRVVCLPPCGQDVLVEFDDDEIGRYTRAQSKYVEFPDAVPIQRMQVIFDVKGCEGVQIARTQFPLGLAWAVNIYKVQSVVLPQIVVDMQWEKGRYEAGMAYIAFSCVRRLEDLYIAHYDRRQMKVNQNAAVEVRRAGQKMIPLMSCPLMLTCTFQEHLAIAQLNVQGLLEKIADLQVCRELMMADVICLSQTHLVAGQSVDDTDIGLSNAGYDVFRLDTGKSDGGLLMFVRRQFDAVQIHVGVEGLPVMLLVKISVEMRDLYLCYISRLQGEEAKGWSDALLSSLHGFDGSPICVFGDMNEDLLDNDVGHPVHDVMLQDGFCQHVSDPTTDYGAMRDLVYTKDISEQAVVTEVLDCYYSTHDMTTCVIAKGFESFCEECQ